jgi:predicted DNA-binding protein YlxM (UPF0122 family)
MKELARRSLLLDYYGGLLTEKQRIIYELYYQEDLSLGEIADLQQVSRNAVYDLITRTDEKLEHYEKALGLIAEDAAQQKAKEALLRDLRAWQSSVSSMLTEPQQTGWEALLERVSKI